MRQTDTFQVLSREVLAEVTRSLALVEDEKAEQVVEKLLGARKVFAIGVGRVLIMLKAFVKRLNHLGIEAKSTSRHAPQRTS